MEQLYFFNEVMTGEGEVNKVFPFCKKTPSKVAEARVLEQHYFVLERLNLILSKTLTLTP